MKTRVIVTLCVVFVWGLVSNACAQVQAGSPEDKAFQKIDAENNVDAKDRAASGFRKTVSAVEGSQRGLPPAASDLSTEE